MKSNGANRNDIRAPEIVTNIVPVCEIMGNDGNAPVDALEPIVTVPKKH